MTQSEWLHMFMVSMLLRGNVYGLIRRDAWPARSIHMLNPDSVRVEVDRDTGRLTYRYTQTSGRSPDRHVARPRADAARQLGRPVPHLLRRAVLGLDLSSRQFASGFFDGGGIPKAILESDQQVNQEQARTIKDRVMATLRGREPLVLGLGLKYTQIQVNPEESQFLATQQANVAQICRYFSVPAAMVDGPSGGGMQYSNTEQRGIEFLTYSWRTGCAASRTPCRAAAGLAVRQVQHPLAAAAGRGDAGEGRHPAARRKIVAPSELRARDGLDPMTEAQKPKSTWSLMVRGPSRARCRRPAPRPTPRLNCRPRRQPQERDRARIHVRDADRRRRVRDARRRTDRRPDPRGLRLHVQRAVQHGPVLGADRPPGVRPHAGHEPGRPAADRPRGPAAGPHQVRHADAVHRRQGAAGRAVLDPSDPDVQRLLPKMRRGDLDEMSFAFRVAGSQGDSWDYGTDRTLRTIREASLSGGDVSVVTYPANPSTSVSLRARDLHEARCVFVEQMAREMRTGRALSPQNIAKLREVLDELGATEALPSC
jgi:phage portal protein BeeE